MHALPLLLASAATVITFGVSLVSTELRRAPIAVEDESGFRVLQRDGDDANGCTERLTLWP